MSHFTGAYVEEMKKLFTASAISNIHALVIDKPGYGKTAIAMSVAQKLQAHTVFIRLDASSPPEKVAGMYDPGPALESPPRLVIDRTNTVFDPLAQIVILDEIWRANDPVWDICLDGLDRYDLALNDAPVVWGTSNFSSDTKRTEALRDRFGLWQYPRAQVNVASVARAQMQSMGQRLTVTDGLPTWADIVKIRNTDPGENAINAVVNVIESIEREVAAGSGDDFRFEINPRRTEQWTRLLFRHGLWITGDPDFKQVPPETKSLLQYAYPLTSPEMAASWAEIVGSIADVINTMINTLLSSAYEKMRLILKSSASKKSSLSLELGKALTDAQLELRDFKENNPDLTEDDEERVEEAFTAIQHAFANAVQGKDPITGEMIAREAAETEPVDSF